MDFTKINCISEKCNADNLPMKVVSQTHFDNRVMMIEAKCERCGLVIGIFQMKSEYEYFIAATTQEERTPMERMKKLEREHHEECEKMEKEFRKKIKQIQESMAQH
jgi:hypothetical protein